MESNKEIGHTEPANLLSFDQRLRLLELATKLFDQECDRMWKRYSAMLTANIILIALFRLQKEEPSTIVLFSSGCLGVVLCICWYKIMVISRHYELRWHKDMVAIIESDPNLEAYLKGRSRDTARDPRPTKRSSCSYASIVILAIAALWIGVIAYGFAKLF